MGSTLQPDVVTTLSVPVGRGKTLTAASRCLQYNVMEGGPCDVGSADIDEHVPDRRLSVLWRAQSIRRQRVLAVWRRIRRTAEDAGGSTTPGRDAVDRRRPPRPLLSAVGHYRPLRSPSGHLGCGPGARARSNTEGP